MCVCRLLGCLTKAQGAQVNRVFNGKYPNETLETLMRRKLSSLFLESCLHMVLGEDVTTPGAQAAHMTPGGFNAEDGDEKNGVTSVGNKSYNDEAQRYSDAPYVVRGENDYRSSGKALPDVSVPAWDGVGVSMDANALRGLLQNYESMNNQITSSNTVMVSEVNNAKLQLFGSVKTLSELKEWDRIQSASTQALALHIAIRDAKDVHLFADSATSFFSSGSAMDNLIKLICDRSRKQISDANAQFYLLYNEDMSAYVRRHLNHSDFSKFIYYVVASSSVSGPNKVYSAAYPGNIVLDVDLIREATQVILDVLLISYVLFKYGFYRIGLL